MGLLSKLLSINHKSHFLVFTQSKNYKGFKKIGLVSYGHTPSEDGLNKLKSQNLSGKKIAIDKFIYGNKNVGYAVFVDGLQVGAVFPDTSAASKSVLDALQSKKIKCSSCQN